MPIVNSTIFNSVQVLETGEYLVSGLTIDTNQTDHLDFITAKFDVYGDLVSAQHFGDSTHQTHTQFHTLSYAPGLFIQQGFGSRNDTASAIYHWFNEDGDTIRSKYVRSPYLQNGEQFASFINPLYSLIMPDSSVYLSTVIAQPVTGNDVCIFRLDKYGNELWHYIYATEADPETCYAMIPWGEGVMAAIDETQSEFEFDTEILLLQLDASGNEIQTFTELNWNNYSSAVISMLSEGDGMVCGGGMSESTNHLSRCAIWKIDQSGNLDWTLPIGDYPEIANASYYVMNLVKCADGNYVGTSPIYSENNMGLNYSIRVTKVSSNGSGILWSRYYNVITSVDDIHYANDLKATPDGGVIFCGQATDVLGDPNDVLNPRQQGWICKLDACGCLVPGCDENCVVGTTENVAVNQQRFKVGPNPANDFLNVYVSPHALTDFHKASFVLYDLQARVVKSFSARQGDTTYILDVGELSAGRYQLVLQNDGMVVETMAVEIVH